MPPRLTLADFVRRAIEVHGAAYDYSKAEYATQFVPVTIGCSKCGAWFQQKPHTHLQGHGCMACAKRKTHEAFLAEARQRHGDKFRYLSRYTTARDPIEIECSTCAARFKQVAGVHLRSHGGCAVCNNKRQRHHTRQFIARAQQVHGPLYEYSRVVYQTSTMKVQIGCRACGTVFLQAPSRHLGGNGCPSCGRVRKPASLAEFIKKARTTHGDLYDYSATAYDRSNKKVTVICPAHGSFQVTPNNHLRGHRCRRCAQAGTSAAEVAWLDALGIAARQVKIPECSVIVDGYDPETRTVYEFLGDFWHGNPAVYPASEMNAATKTAFGALYDRTQQRLQALAQAGYTVLYVWEADWTAGKRLSKALAAHAA